MGLQKNRIRIVSWRTSGKKSPIFKLLANFTRHAALASEYLFLEVTIKTPLNP